MRCFLYAVCSAPPGHYQASAPSSGILLTLTRMGATGPIVPCCREPWRDLREVESQTCELQCIKANDGIEGIPSWARLLACFIADRVGFPQCSSFLSFTDRVLVFLPLRISFWRIARSSRVSSPVSSSSPGEYHTCQYELPVFEYPSLPGIH